MNLADLAAAAHTAIVTQECQGAVMGPDAGLAVLAEEARREAVPNIEDRESALLPQIVAILRAAHISGEPDWIGCVVYRSRPGIG